MEIEEDLSENIKCYWRIVKEERSPEEYNILSVSLFHKKSRKEMKEDQYFKGLQELFQMMRNELPTYRLRVYHDGSVASLLTKYRDELREEERQYVELYQYRIPYLADGGDPDFHQGTTGTLWRFLPLMNYPLHRVSRKVILDVDTEYNSDFVRLIGELDRRGDVDFAYRTHSYYYRNPRVRCMNREDKIPFYLVAHFIYHQKMELDQKILVNFLDRYIYQISNANLKMIMRECYPQNSENRKKRGVESQMDYGVDEIFMNGFYLLEMMKEKGVRMILIYYSTHYDYNKIFYDFFGERDPMDKRDNKKIELFLTHFFRLIGPTSLKILEKEGVYRKRWDLVKLAKVLKESELLYQMIQKYMINAKNEKRVRKLFRKEFNFSLHRRFDIFLKTVHLSRNDSFVLFPYQGDQVKEIIYFPIQFRFSSR